MTARKKKAKSPTATAKAAAAAVAKEPTASCPGAASPSSPANGGNIDAVLAEASTFAEAGRLDEAADGFARASALAPRRVDVLDALAEAAMEAGRPDEARAALRRSIELAPQTGFEKYMYLSQLLGSTMEAVEVSRAGVEVLRREKAALGNGAGRAGGAGDVEVRKEEISGFEVSALCGVAEVLLSVIEESQDQGVADRLDGQVELAIGEALAVCVSGSQGEMEASMALANLRLSQARASDARVAMERVVAGMAAGLDVLDGEDDEDGGDESIIRGIGLLPPMPIRVAVGKQLVEVELWEDAVRVLSSVLHECDFNIEVWYMLAFALNRLGEGEQAMAALERLRGAVASPEGHDGQLVDGAVEELAAAVRGGASDTARRKGGGGDDDMKD